MSKPKRHHYLPQFYLTNFCRDGGFCVFDRERNEFRPQTPINTALISHYYSLVDQDGTRRTEIESLLLAKIEDHAKLVIAKLLAKDIITEEEKGDLSIFVAFMMNRVPDFEKSVNTVHEHLIKRTADLMFSDEERAQAIMNQREKDTGEKPDISAKELVKFHKSGRYKIVIPRNQSLRLMVTLSLKIAKYFRQMDWGIFHAPSNTSFITTDNPVVLVPPADEKPGFYGVGVITKGVRKVFPLSQTACLIMFDHGNLVTHRDADRQSVRNINLTVTSNSDRFVIGRDETLVRNMIDTTRLAEWKSKGRFCIG